MRTIFAHLKKKVSLETSLLMHCYIPTYTQLIAPPNQIRKSQPAHRRRDLELIFTGSEVTAQTRLRVPMTL